MSKAIELADELEKKKHANYVNGKLVDSVVDELRRLAAIEQAALKLVKCKGRYHTEQNMIALGELLGVKMPPAICEKDDEKWKNPNDKEKNQYLPWIDEEVLFFHKGKTYYGKHTGGSFVSGHGFAKKEFVTWECKWMYLPKYD